jgi:hypothetical protein
MFVGFEAVAEDKKSAVDAVRRNVCLRSVSAREKVLRRADGDNAIASISWFF